MNDEPLVSCIIPTYNREKKVINAISSVLTQSYFNLEVLVVDDQSIDDTRVTVEELAKNDSRIKYFYNPVKGGNNARNFGIKNAKGEYIAFLDDDDIWLKSKIKKQVESLQLLGEEYGVSYCTYARTRTNGKVAKRHPSRFSKIREGNVLNDLLKRNFISTCSLLVKADVFEKAGMFDPSYKSFQDWELFIRLAQYYHFSYINEILVEVFESEDSITLNKTGRVLTSFKLLKQNMCLYKKNSKILSYRYCYIGFTLLKLKRYRGAKLFLQKSLKYNKLNAEAYLHLTLLSVAKIFFKR